MTTPHIPRKTTFGPGALESLTLTSWTNKHGIRKVRLAGPYTVYTQHGRSDVRIDITECLSNCLDTFNEQIPDADKVARTLVEWALDGLFASEHWATV